MGETVSLTNRRKQLRYRANHRGIKEMDIILGRFADRFLGEFNIIELNGFEAFMVHNDRDLLQWFTGEIPVPKGVDMELFKKISSFALMHLQPGHST